MSDVNSPAAPAAASARDSTGAPQHVLSVFDGVMIIVGIIIGGGIFAFPPLVAGMTGSVPWMFGAWLFGAALALIGALCYAELATTFRTPAATITSSRAPTARTCRSSSHGRGCWSSPPEQSRCSLSYSVTT